MGYQRATQTKVTQAGRQRATATVTGARSPKFTQSHPLLQLQRQIGNRAVSQLIQAKLKVGKPNDTYEIEADRVADTVMRMSASPMEFQKAESGETVHAKSQVGSITPLVQRQAEEKEEETAQTLQRQEEEEETAQTLQRQEEEEETAQTLQRQEEEEETAQTLQRQEEEEEEETAQTLQRQEEEETAQTLQRQEEEEETAQTLQRQEEEEETAQTKASTGQTPQVSPGLENRIHSVRGGGQPLPDSDRDFFEPRFGYDFSGVRIHADSHADSTAQELNAQAFTVGQDIFFSAGRYEPHTTKGKHLLAHELTHTIQQQPRPAEISRSQLQFPQRSLFHNTQRNRLSKSPTKVGHSQGLAVSPASRMTVQRRRRSATPNAPVATQTAESPKSVKTAAVASPEVESTGVASPTGTEAAVATTAKTEAKAPTTEKAPAKKPAPEKAVAAEEVTKAETVTPEETGGEKTPASPEEDPGFQAVIKRAKGVAAKQSSHPPATVKAQEAQAAAEAPASEVESKAQARQVGEMEQAQTPAFDKKAFKAALMKRIAEIAPKSLEDADNFKKENKLEGVKQETTAKVKDEKTASQKPLQDKTAAAPDTSGIEPKPVKPLPAANPGKAPPKLGAEQAVPKVKQPKEVEAPLQAESNKPDQEMAAADVTEEQLKKSNEPEFEVALSAKTTAKTHAAEAPQEYRQFEQEKLTQAETEAVGTAQKQTRTMYGDRSKLLTQVKGQQGEAKSKDEQARAKVASDIQKIYDTTKTKVDTILQELDGKVEKAFDQGAAAAKKFFENYVDLRMRRYKAQRYGGIGGGLLWGKDKLFGMPDEVNVFYEEGRELYLQRMDAVIDNVVNIIGAELTRAKTEIAQGKKEIQDYVAKLPDNLKSVGEEAAADIQTKFEELEETVNSKQDALIDTLAQKYQENLKAVDDRINQMKEANKGLVAKAIGAIKAVIETIRKLKQMLDQVLARISGVIGLILKDPIKFFKNLIAGLKQGFNNFVANIAKHLQAGLIAWLTGALGPVGIQIPDDLFSLKGIFSLVMQVLGLTWDYIRKKAVKLFGEKVVAAMEKTVEIFQVLQREGPAGLWEYIKEQFSNLKEMVMDQIKDMVITEVIKAGVKWILSLLNPVAAFIKAAMAIYNIIMFFVERAAQIVDFINSVIDAIAAIAKGALAGAAKLVENALAKSIPLIIGMLASLLGISGLAKKVQKIIQRIRKRIDKAITKLLVKAKKAIRKLLKSSDKKEPNNGKVEDQAFQVHTTFQVGKEKHELENKGGSIELTLSSANPTALDKHPNKGVRNAYSKYLKDINSAKSPTARKKAANKNIRTIVKLIKDAGMADVPGASAPGIGTIDRHKNQQIRMTKVKIPVWALESEHIIPRGFINAAFLGLAQSGVPAGKPDYKNMHTILIYKGAADLKTEGSSGDASKINTFTLAIKEIVEEVFKTRQIDRARARELLADTTFRLLNESAADAQIRTNSAIKQENKKNGAARGPEGSPEPPIPTPSQVSAGYEAQKKDINAQLQERINSFIESRGK